MPQSICEIRRKARERAAAERARDRDAVNAKKRLWAKTEKAKATKKRWNLAHPDSVRATRHKRVRIDRKAERDTPERAAKANARSRKWYWEHLEIVRERNRIKQHARCEANRESFNGTRRKYMSLQRARNPEKFRVYTRNRKAMKRAADGTHTAIDTAKIRALQGDKCAYCRVRLSGRGHLDHIVALANGGSNWARNLQWLCVSCNGHKHAKDPIEFAQSIGRLL